ncbi:hypothetical protein JOD63_002151 [Microbacterium terrae]|uniref:Glycosyl hydrolase family 67 C-terminal domain-containing protein n=1 Tax=Microbacterium terrae TaxID=69369 RepID=A0A0M2HLA3_9MICO|nr:hypothetical protein [Microbacterium terrae]KJL45144.1 hypothetical protein RS81_00326 [Microbacterium terrae]MBP1078183.1 hypothetical protein [Microbacterium terrae]GLJ97662.1 hypothetical protein GCM10017594_08590 [Microbacterium terrae]
MTRATRRGILAVVTVLVLVALGAGIGLAVGDALGIRTEPAEQMQPAAATVAEVSETVAPPEITALDVPTTERVGVAVDELLDAIADAPERSGELALSVAPVVDDEPGSADDPASDESESAPDSTGPATADTAHDSYSLTGDAAALRITADTDAGVTRAIYDLARAVRAGTSVAGLVGEHEASVLPLRMTDLGAVGVTPDPAAWEAGTDYSHASEAFADVILPEAPYIDEAALAAAYDDFDVFLRHSLANGFNAVAFPGFVEFVTFDDAPGGPVYAEGDDHRDKALALREAFTPFWDRADELGVQVMLRTDMLALTTPLQQHLEAEFGSLDTENPEFWQTYTAGLDELYAASPALDGVLIRIGEAGDVYDVDGWDVYSALAVTSVDAVRAMLEAFTAQAEASFREVIFRTWSVGVGAVGDMHTNAESYEAVLGGIDSPALIVSTKYTLGDFYSWLPLNDTLEQGEQRRIVEFQSRREFENFGAFANDLGAEYQWAMQQLLAANDRIEGAWVWTQDGGPWRAGPMSLYLKSGFWQLYELNTQLAAALAVDPDADVSAVTAAWAREWFSDDPATVSAIARAMTSSREAISQGLYIEQFADKRVFAIGLEPPPMMWIFEWDILTGDSAVLDVLYSVVRDSGDGAVEAAIARGADAVAAAERMSALVEETDASTWRDPAMRDALTGALGYELDTLKLLGAYRETILHRGEWHDTASAGAYAAWEDAKSRFEVLAAEHLEKYTGDLDHPAYNLTAAELGIERSERDLAMAWIARILLVLAAAWVVIGMLAARTRLVRRPGAAAARASWIASTRPWRARESTLGMLELDRWLMLGIPAALLVATRAVQTSLLSWSHLAITLGGWLVFALVVRLCVGRRSPWPVIAAVGGVVVLRCILTLAALSFTGPGGYWFAFWTDPVLRTIYIALAFAGFVWAFVAAGWALATHFGARRATGFVLAAVGAALAVPAVIIGAIGLETALTQWNDEMGLLPWGLARILGITTYLEIPVETPWFASVLGAGLAVLGAILALPGKRPFVDQTEDAAPAGVDS